MGIHSSECDIYIYIYIYAKKENPEEKQKA